MANQTVPLNRGLSTNFWCLRSANYVKFSKQCVMCIEKHDLIKKKKTKKIYKLANYVCHYEPKSKQSMESKLPDSLLKKCNG